MKAVIAVGLLSLAIWLGLVVLALQSTDLMVRASSKHLLDATSERVSAHLEGLYQPIQSTTAMLAFSQLLNTSTAQERLEYVPMMADVLSRLSAATALQVGYESGDYIIVRKLTLPKIAERFDAPPTAQYVADHITGGTGKNERWYFGPNVTPIKYELLEASQYDPRVRPWYVQAIASDQAEMTSPYVFFFMMEIGVTSARANRTKMAVVATDIELSSIHETLQQTKITPGSMSALLGESGVVAWSEDLPVLYETDSGLNRRTLAELGDPILAQMANQQTPEGWLLHQIQIDAGVPTELVMAVPQAELIPELNQLQRNALFGSMVILVILLPLVWILADRATRPLRSLHRAIEKVGSGELDFWLPDIQSHDEIGDLNLAIRTMRSSLKQHIDDLQEATTARERLEGELNVARKIQMGLVPGAGALKAAINQDSVYARLMPAKAVGGDLYDLIELPNGQYFLAVGDVSDKGVPAALFMSRTVTLAKMLVPRTENLSDLLSELNNELSENNDECMFITLFCAVIDPNSDQIRYACAGHNPPIVVKGGKAELLPLDSGSPLGLFPGRDYVESTATLGKGDRLVIYSDGITEAFDVQKNEFSEERLVELMAAFGSEHSAIEAGEHILNEVKIFAGEAAQSDDITVLILDRT